MEVSTLKSEDGMKFITFIPFIPIIFYVKKQNYFSFIIPFFLVAFLFEFGELKPDEIEILHEKECEKIIVSINSKIRNKSPKKVNQDLNNMGYWIVKRNKP